MLECSQQKLEELISSAEKNKIEGEKFYRVTLPQRLEGQDPILFQYCTFVHSDLTHQQNYLFVECNFLWPKS